MKKIFLFVAFLLCLAFTSISKGQPTLLKKIEKKEKFREEVLVTKQLDINDLYLKKYLSLELVKNIFPQATRFDDIDLESFSSAIYNREKLIGYIFETFDVTKGLGYSRRPFHIAVGIDTSGFIRKVKLLKHVEPIAILGRTDNDFIKYLEQYKNIDLKSGISLTLELTGADIDGDSVAMRETAGEIKNLTQIDGVSRTTTSSLLFMDAIIRGARKIARQKGILLANNDLGNFIDLEKYKPQSWIELLDDKSMTLKSLDINFLLSVFKKENYQVPRALKYKKGEDLFANIYFASVFPSGIGVNILGRRWYDQYISAGRNVDDQVYYIAFEGDLWREFEGRIGNLIKNNKLYIKQDKNIIPISKKLFKELPFNHAKKAPDLMGQGLIYLNSKYNLDPQKSIEIIYVIENKEDNEIDISLDYRLPESYYKIKFTSSVQASDNGVLKVWKNSKLTIFFSFLTVLFAYLLFIYNEYFTSKHKYFHKIRILFLIWTLVWLGWIIGGQLSIIHYVNIITSIFHNNSNMIGFLIEPSIFIIGIGTILSLILWGRGVFCGWLCPFGAFQELISFIGKMLRIKSYNLPENYDKFLKYLKYVLLLMIIIFAIIESNAVNFMYNLEPFKTAITLKFMAPSKAIIWSSFTLIISLFIERAYCRYICPLGAGLAVLGNLRTVNFLKRKEECGNPCKACSKACPTGAILNSGKVNMNECLGCLDCQVMYYNDNKCPPLIAIKKINKNIKLVS